MHDDVVVGLRAQARGVNIPDLKSFLLALETGVVAIWNDTQYVMRLNLKVSKVMRQKREYRYASVPFSSVGCHWVAPCDAFALPQDFLVSPQYPPEGSITEVSTGPAVADDQKVSVRFLPHFIQWSSVSLFRRVD
jgi:hypothetical protein